MVDAGMLQDRILRKFHASVDLTHLNVKCQILREKYLKKKSQTYLFKFSWQLH